MLNLLNAERGFSQMGIVAFGFIDFRRPSFFIVCFYSIVCNSIGLV